jgi:hypothetical protein
MAAITTSEPAAVSISTQLPTDTESAMISEEYEEMREASRLASEYLHCQGRLGYSATIDRGKNEGEWIVSLKWPSNGMIVGYLVVSLRRDSVKYKNLSFLERWRVLRQLK